MYAIIKTGGKQYRVQQGQSLLVERLPAADGETVALQPLLFVNGADVVDGEALTSVKVEAKVVAHERGPKLRIVKFKPKRGYRRRTGHRQELTRIEVVSLGPAAKRGRAGSKAANETPAPAAASAEAGASAEAASAPETESTSKPAAPKREASRRKPATGRKPAAETKPAAESKPAAQTAESKAVDETEPATEPQSTTETEDTDGT